jgi:hypothetical protein
MGQQEAAGEQAPSWRGSAAAALASLVVAVIGVTSAGGAGAASDVPKASAVPSPSLVAASPSSEHPVWRLDRLAGHPLVGAMSSETAGLGIGAERHALRRRVENVADRVAPFDWRALGITFGIGCHPVEGHACPLGVAIPTAGGGRIMLAPTAAYLTEAGIEVVIAHELAHLWQFGRHPQHVPGSIVMALELERPAGVDPAELEADCLAAAWGYALDGDTTLSYWTCPPDAVAAAEAAFLASTSP